MREPRDILREHAGQFNDDAVEVAERLLDQWDAWQYGKSPAVGAAGAAYYAQHVAGVGSRSRVLKADVAEMFGVSEPAMTAWRDSMLDELGLDTGLNNAVRGGSSSTYY